MHTFKMSHKLWAMLAIALSFVALISIFGLNRLYDHLLDDKKRQVRNLVETAHSLIAYQADLAASGKLSESQAKQQALNSVQKLRYEGNNYFWINDMHPRMIMHPFKPELKGQDLSGTKDPNGTALFTEMVKTANKSGAGYVNYMWPKPGMDKPVEKISYVKEIEQWGWIVGSGIYIDDVAAVHNRETMTQLSILAVLALIMTGLMLWMQRLIQRPLSLAAKAADNIASGKFDQPIPQLESRDELAVMMHSLDQMRTTLGDQIKQDQLKAVENGRIKQALDNVSTNILVADTNDTIIYINQSFSTALNTLETDIRRKIPQFSANSVLGSNTNQLLSQQTISSDSIIRLGSHTFTVVSSPVSNESGQQIGTVTELIDRTQQLAVEQEVQTIVDSAQAGDLAVRVDLHSKDGFFYTLSEAINHLMEVNQSVIDDTVKVLGALANGNLNQRIETDYQGAFNDLKTNANETASKLTEIIRNIQANSEQLLADSEEISQGNQDLSQRTESQAASLEETASSMAEMTGTVRQSADNAQRATKLATTATSLAEQGGNVVNQAISAMAKIKASSRKISEIIIVIDEIAFQTNLLALNAAVEAAHAGEEGRGFAVVASEVRELAQRSADAAREIKGLIKESVDEVDGGTALVDESGDALEQILVSVNKVSEIIVEISSANQEQATGIEQVNLAVSRMDSTTQKNAALVEEVAASSEALQQQANELKNLIAFFDIGQRREVTWSPSIETTPDQESVYI